VVEILTTVLPAGWPGVLAGPAQPVLVMTNVARSAQPLLAASVAVIAVGCVLGGAVTAIRSRRWGRLAVAASGALSVLVVAGSGLPLGPDSSRYAALLLPPLAAFVVAACRIVPGSGARIGGLLVVTLGVLSVAGSAADSGGYASNKGAHYGAEVREIAGYLARERLDAVYADYWIAYPITAQSNESVTAAALATDRHRPYADRAAAAQRTVVVALTGGDNERALRVGRGLPPSTTTRFDLYSVIVFDAPVVPELLPRNLW